MLGIVTLFPRLRGSRYPPVPLGGQFGVKQVNKKCAMRGIAFVWLSVRCMAFSTLYGLQYVVWLAVRCMACSTLYDLQYIVWLSVHCMACSTLYGFQYIVWLVVRCMAFSTLYGLQYFVWLAVHCMACSTLYGFQYIVIGGEAVRGRPASHHLILPDPSGQPVG